MVGEGALERQSVHGKDEGNTIILAGTGSPLLVFDILKMVIMEKGAKSLVTRKMKIMVRSKKL